MLEHYTGKTRLRAALALVSNQHNARKHPPVAFPAAPYHYKYWKW